MFKLKTKVMVEGVIVALHQHQICSSDRKNWLSVSNLTFFAHTTVLVLSYDSTSRSPPAPVPSQGVSSIHVHVPPLRLRSCSIRITIFELEIKIDILLAILKIHLTTRNLTRSVPI